MEHDQVGQIQLLFTGTRKIHLVAGYWTAAIYVHLAKQNSPVLTRTPLRTAASKKMQQIKGDTRARIQTKGGDWDWTLSSCNVAIRGEPPKKNSNFVSIVRGSPCRLALTKPWSCTGHGCEPVFATVTWVWAFCPFASQLLCACSTFPWTASYTTVPTNTGALNHWEQQLGSSTVDFDKVPKHPTTFKLSTINHHILQSESTYNYYTIIYIITPN